MKDGTKRAAAKAPDTRRDPTEREAASLKRATERILARPKPVSVRGTCEGREIDWGADHSDSHGHMRQLMDTLGTCSSDFLALGATSLCDVMKRRGQAFPEPHELNGGLAAVAGIAPDNEVEAMLAVQMVGTHEVAMNMLTRAKQANDPSAIERYGTLATKLLRTYTAQMEALAKVRRGGEQKVKVEHVHVYQGGQAVVGNVMHTSGQTGGRLETGNQPHALAEPSAYALSDGAPMLRSDALRPHVPVARSEGQGPVPDAWRRKGKRRTQG